MDSVDVALSIPKPQPRISSFIGDDSKSYVIICEQQILCKLDALQNAIFIMFAAYYCFNLEYPTPAKNVFSFLQDYIIEYPDSSKKTASYLAVVSDIKRFL